MTLRLLFTINAIVATLFGIAFLLVPGSLLAIYGLSADAGAVYLARLLGGAFLGYGAVSWLVRGAEDSSARRGLVLGYFVGFAAGLVAALVGQLAGTVNALGWSTVAIYGFFTLAYGYFQFARQSGA